MSFDWKEFLRVARSHIGEREYPNADAKNRCAISRAYYAAFHFSEDYVRKHFPEACIGTAGEVHHKMPIWLLNHENPELNQVGMLLDRMRPLRREADYKPRDMPRLHDLAYSAVCDSAEVIQIVQKADSS